MSLKFKNKNAKIMQHTTLLLALLVYFSRFRQTNTLLRTLLVLQTGQKNTNMTME